MSYKRTIKGREYLELDAGILIPAELCVREGSQVRKPADLVPALAEEMVAEQERFVVFSLDAARQIIRKHTVTIGLANQSQVHPRETFRPAIQDGAVSIIIAHNHTSGSLEASCQDLIATKRLAEAGRLLGIPLEDHLIVSREGFVSLREKFPDYFTTTPRRD
jgi:DNA repair protein RadC